MSDIVERAEAALAEVSAEWGVDPAVYVTIARRLVPDLLAELKSARTEAEQWKALWRQNTATASEAIRERDEATRELAEERWGQIF